MKRAALFLLGLAACKGEGPDAPPRKNGCIDTGCAPVTTATPGDTTTPDSGTAPLTGTNPLAGTNSTAALVKGGLHVVQGAVWVGGRLLVSDTAANQILELGTNNDTTVFRATAMTNGARGLGTDRTGNLYTCEATRVAKSAATKGAAITAVAEMYQENPFDGPHDVVVRADGNVYFTDATSGTDTQDAQAAYRVAGGTLTRLGGTFGRPAGIALAPDGNTLYVVDASNGNLYSAVVAADGSVGGFAQLGSVPGGDGLTTDDNGNLYVADTAGVDVLTPAGGKIGTVTVAVKPTNVSFGGADRKTLYITANGADGDAKTGIYSIVLGVPGLP